jgi:cation:H+ antiporter
LVLLATVTSLPELITGISAVTLVDAPDLAMGSVLGSCVFNLAIIVVLDFLVHGETVFMRVSQGHVLAAGFGIILIGVVGFGLLLERAGLGVSLGPVSLTTPIVAVIYLVAVRAVFRYERSPDRLPIEEAMPSAPGVTLRSAYVRYAGAAVLVVGTGLWLPFVGRDLAVAMDVHDTFVGTLFLALATSLPEVVVTVAALRIGAFNMAVSNLFGSNLFNIAILVPIDLCYLRAPLLASISELHLISGASAIVMTGIAVVGLMYRPRRTFFGRLGWASLFLLWIYLINFYVLYLYDG